MEKYLYRQDRIDRKQYLWRRRVEVICPCRETFWRIKVWRCGILFERNNKEEDFVDILKTRIDNLDLSTRTLNALNAANVRTLGGLARKKMEDLLEIEGIGGKGITEIKKVLSKFGLNLKD